MMKCIEVTELASQEMERPLGLAEQVSLRAHLLMCSGCSNYRRQLKTLRETMKIYAAGGAVTSDTPNGDLK